MATQRTPISRILRAAGRRLGQDDGSTSVMALYFLMISMIMGGLAVDFNKAMAHRTQLQISADAVAHAALYSRENMSGEDAIASALELAEVILPSDMNGIALLGSDIQFGDWDLETNEFTARSGSKTAVQVDAARIAERDNQVSSILLRMIGYDSFDITRSSVFSTYQPVCFREGFVAEGVVDIQSNNNFFNGFCLHSNSYVSLNSNNFFEPGTIVSMPDSSQIDLPNSGFETNDGLDLALRDGAYRLRLVNRLADMIDSLMAGGSKYVPDYVSGTGFVTVSSNNFEPGSFTAGRKHIMTCNGGNAAQAEGGTYSGFLLVTNCKIKFKSGVVLEDVTIATSNYDSRSFNAPSGLQLGRDDNCAAGGGAVLMTKGGFNVASDLRMYGGQILALGDVQFAANANGIQGASIIAGGEIDGTSNMSMSYCGGSGMEDIYEADYFRMVN